MANGLRQVDTWRDSKGRTATMRYYVASTGTQITQAVAASNVNNAFQPCSNAHTQTVHGPSNNPAGPVGYGTTADFPSVEDKAVLTFSAADGSLHRYKLPAPKIAIFEVDTVTVDAAQADIAGAITAVIANVVTASGAAITSYVGGTRSRVKLQRRLNIFVKVPELDEPAE